MSKQVFMTRNLAFSKFMKHELATQGVKVCEFEKACGINKGAQATVGRGIERV